MKISELINKLEKDFTFNYSVVEDVNLTNFSILTNQIQQFDSHCLYAGQIFKEDTMPLNIITSQPIVNRAQNYIYVKEEQFPELLNAIINLFLFVPKKENEYEQFISKANDEKNLHLLMNAASILLERSLVLIDTGFQVIDYSTSVKITDPIWEKNIKNRKVTYEFIKEMNKLIPKSIEIGKPFYVNCSYSTENKLCTALAYHNTQIGYLVLLDNNKGIESFHIKYLPGIAQSLMYALENVSGFSLIFSQIISDLFRTVLTSQEEKYNAALQLRQKCTLPESMYLICIHLKDTNSHSLSYIKNIIRSIFLKGYTFLYNECVLSVIGKEEINKLEDGSLKEIQPQLKNIGISSCFYDLLELSSIYTQVKETIQIGERMNENKFLYFADSYRTYRLLNHCDSLDEFIHPALNMLKDKELLETLDVFIQNGCNIQKSSEQLFIHRNTLTYRLKKICDSTGLDFENPETIFELNYSFKILKLKKKL